MKFEMTSPCESCPFRTDKLFFLTPARAQEIVDALLTDKTFSCHKTVDYGKLDEECDQDGNQGAHVPDADEQHCAGALIILERLERPNQMMRWMERLGAYDRRKLKMDAPVFENFEEFVESMEALEGRRAACRRRATARDAAPATSRATARPRTASGKRATRRKKT